jgi:hypothetical protein
MSCRPRRALMLGLVAAATAVAIVPAAAATKARPRPPAPLTIYPSTTSCPQSGNATYALDTVPGDAADNCMALEVGTDGAGKPVGPRSDEDYLATSRVKVKLAKSGSIAGTIGINATTFEGGAAFVGYADVSLTMVINNVVVGTVEKSGPITPTADLAVPVRRPCGGRRSARWTCSCTGTSPAAPPSSTPTPAASESRAASRRKLDEKEV